MLKLRTAPGSPDEAGSDSAVRNKFPAGVVVVDRLMPGAVIEGETFCVCKSPLEPGWSEIERFSDSRDDKAGYISPYGLALGYAAVELPALNLCT